MLTEGRARRPASEPGRNLSNHASRPTIRGVNQRSIWLIVGPLLLIVVGVVGALIGHALGVVLPSPVALAIPNVLLALSLLGIVAWVVVRVTKRDNR